MTSRPVPRLWPASLLGARHRLYGQTATLVYSTLTINVLRIFNTMVLTRLLAPRDFGLSAIVMSVFFVLAMITDAGFQAFIVRHRDGEDPAFLDAVWSVHVSRGWLICLVALALAIPISRVMGSPDIAPILAVSSLTFAIEGSGSLTMMTAIRKGLVRTLSMVDLLIFVTQMVTGIVAALFIRNVWSMVIAMIVTSFARVLCSYVVFPESRRRFRPDRAVTRELWGFSRMIAMSSMLTLVLAQIDKLLLARVFSLPMFGVYAVSANLASAPQGVVGAYASRMIYPLLARVHREDPTDLRRAYYANRGVFFYGFVFLTGVLIGAAPLVIGLLYDSRYAGADYYLRILAVATSFGLLTRSMSELLVASGYVKATLAQNLARIAWLAPVGALGFWLAGANGLIMALGSIEIPAYAVGAVLMAHRGLLRVRGEMFSFLLIAAGAFAGWAACGLLGLIRH